jgi:hypothetical protein
MFFVLLSAGCAKTGYKIDFKAGEGSVDVKDTARILLNSDIPEGRVILVSLHGEKLPEKNEFSIRLFNAQDQPVKLYGGWYQQNRMSYFITSGKPGKYYLIISPDTVSAEYTVKVKINHVVAPFRKMDSKGNASDLLTYMISNSPEELEPGKRCMGEEGSYLVRSKVQGNANLYWEHCNNLGYDIKFGVLLWNRDTRPIHIKLNSSSAKSWTGCNGMEGAMCGVWIDWFGNKLNDNELELDDPVMLPAYNERSPSASARWVFMSTAPKNEPVKNTFNGLLNMSISTEDGSLYDGDRLFCDMYAITPGKEDLVLKQVALNDFAPDEGKLRGSGVGAMAETTLPKVEIRADNPFRFLITGFDPPFFQEGENVPTTFFNRDGEAFHLPTSYGYSNVYKFNCSGFVSEKPVKAGFRMHPNSWIDKWAGIYVIGKRERDGVVFSKQVLISQNDLFVFDEDVPLNKNTTYYLVVSGMSSLPVEVVFCN